MKQQNLVSAFSTWIVKFFGGGPYRFLMLLMGAALFMGFATLQMILSEKNTLTQCAFAIFFFAFYLLASCFYSFLIYRGKWRDFWAEIQRCQEVTKARVKKMRESGRVHRY
jgi:hypothetical protein